MSDTDTRLIAKKTMRISPETEVAVRLGLLATGAASLVIATVFVWNIKANGEQALREIQALRADYNTLAAEHRELWWNYQRTTMRAATGPAGP